MSSDRFTAGSGEIGEIVDHDDIWVAFRYSPKRYEKVPAGAGAEDPFRLEPVKGAVVTQYLRITDIESIDEVTDEN